MNTQEKLNEMLQRRAEIEEGGGQKRVDQQHSAGKMTARERIEQLLDHASFVEIDAFVTHRATDLGMDKTSAPAEGVVCGYGTVDGRLIYIYAQDFTVIGGSLGEMHAKKICKVMDMAIKMGTPIVGLNDSGGARIQEGIDALCGFGEIFRRNTHASGVVPQISVIMGPCAGGAVYSPAICDFVFMVENTSQMFITGPQVIKSVTGEEVDAESLGGAAAHNTTSGVAHFSAQSEEECFAQVRTLLGLIPPNNLGDAPQVEIFGGDDDARENLASIVPDGENKAYDIKKIIFEVVDDGFFFEVHKDFAKNIVVGFARISGRSVGVVANQPNHMAGALDYDSSDKAARFIRFCDCFNIPVLTFTDVPGYLPGVAQEHNGIIRHGAKLLYAYSEATVPKVTVIVRKAYGGAYIAMGSKHLGADVVLAWPTAQIAVMGPDGAANIIFRNEIKNADDPASERKRLIEDYKGRFANPYIAAARGYVDDVIDPVDTRRKLVAAFDMLASKREGRPQKKHGNIPL